MQEPGTPEYEAAIEAAESSIDEEAEEESKSENAAVTQASLPGSPENEAAKEAVFRVAGVEEGTPEADIAI